MGTSEMTYQLSPLPLFSLLLGCHDDLQLACRCSSLCCQGQRSAGLPGSKRTQDDGKENCEHFVKIGVEGVVNMQCQQVSCKPEGDGISNQQDEVGEAINCTNANGFYGILPVREGEIFNKGHLEEWLKSGPPFRRCGTLPEGEEKS